MQELDLTNQQAVAAFFESERPDYVILAAARVGGILANDQYRAQFIYENLMIEANIIHQSYLSGVRKLLFLGSSCIYPKNAPQPLREEYLLTGELEPTNEPYAVAKIAGIKLCESYFRQYGCNFLSVMPTNLYGPNDNYNLETSHVLPAIIRKTHLARCLETNDMQGIRKDLEKRPIEGINGEAQEAEILKVLRKYGIHRADGKVLLHLWGTGRVFREFMHVDDMAGACVKVLEEVNVTDLVDQNEPGSASAAPAPTFLNIGTGEDQTIAEIAGLIKSIIGFTGEIRWDTTKPDGTHKKLLDVSKLRKLGVTGFLPLGDGIRSVYKHYNS
jgi:GDP-L-fucose synthase